MKKIVFVFISLLYFSNLGIAQTDTFIEKVEAYLKELSKDPNFSLAVSISKDDQVLLEKAFGYANREHQIANQPNTKFNIASIGKLFTAVSILQLYEQNKLDLQEVIGKYIPDFPHSFIRDSVSIHQLLTHSSGLPLWFHESFDRQPKFDFLELEDYLPLYDSVQVDNSKIGKNSYSNVGFITLGFLIEAVSNMSYKAYLNQHIFEPLGMKETNIWSLTEIIPNVATGYVRPSSREDWWKTNFHLNMGSSPAGGAFSSVKDLIKFYIGLNSDKLMKAETRALMFAPKIKTYYGQYGYGVGINQYNNQSFIGHLGGYYGVRGELMWYKDAGYIVSILANSDQTDYADLSYFIKMTLTGTTAEQEAFNRTFQFIKANDLSQMDLSPSNLPPFLAKKMDESLIQIKGYYHLNNQSYDLAKKYFYLNTLLFPESNSAKRDYERFNRD